MTKVTSPPDTNAKVGALLRDLAACADLAAKQVGLQTRGGRDSRSRGAARIAAAARRHAAQDSTTSARRRYAVIYEFLRTGRSEIVEQAVGESARAGDVARSRELRGNFLSSAQVAEVLRFQKNRGLGLRDYQRRSADALRVQRRAHDARRDWPKAASHADIAYCAVTDHSYGLPIAHGVSMSDLKKQHAEINRAQSPLQRPIPHSEGHRGQHPRGRRARHDAARAAHASKSSSRRRTRSFAPATIRPRAW